MFTNYYYVAFLVQKETYKPFGFRYEKLKGKSLNLALCFTETGNAETLKTKVKMLEISSLKNCVNQTVKLKFPSSL